MSEITNQLKKEHLVRLFRWCRFSFLTLLLLLGSSVLGQNVGTIQIGSGTEVTNSASATIPITNYVNSWTQHIITADEYSSAGGVVGQITAIRFKLANVYQPERWNQIKIYFANTEVSAFNSNTDFIPFSEFTQHFSATLQTLPVVGEWYTITLDTPFEYTGDNIVIGVHENAPEWQGQTEFYVYPAESNRGIVWRSDANDIVLETHVFSTNTYLVENNLLPQMQFVGAVADCLPVISATSVTEAYQATISWQANATDVSYSWKMVANGAGVDGVAIASGTTEDLSVVITDLDPATNYDFYLKAFCADAQESSWSSKLDFVTLCAPVSNDIFENFDSTVAFTWNNGGFLPFCWSYISNDSWSSARVESYSYNSWDLDGDFVSLPNNVVMRPDGSGSEVYLISPETVNLGAGSKELTFAARTLYSDVEGVILNVGIMTDPEDPSTFTMLAGGSIDLIGLFQSYTVQIPVGTTADYFAFKLVATDWGQSVVIDDVMLAPAPACPPILLNSIVADPLLSNQANISWEGESTNYDVKLVNTITDEEELFENITGNTLVLTDLSQSTTYEIYVRANCSGTEDGVSSYSNPKLFVTQTMLPSPWYEPLSSSALPIGWETNMYIWNNQGNFMFDAYLASGSDDSILITPNIGPILPGDKFSFDYNNGGYDSSIGSIQILISTDQGINYDIFDEIEYNGESGFQNFEATLDGYLEDTVKFKLIATFNTESDDWGYGLNIDNFYIGSCPLPALPTTLDATNESVTLTWIANSSSTYQVEYGPVGFVLGQGTLTEVISGGTVTITGLEGASNYEFYFKENCSEDSSSPWIGKGNMITKCDPFEGAFTQDFNSPELVTIGAVNFPLCWNVIKEGSGNAYVDTWGSYYYMYNGSDVDQNMILVSPETNNLGDGLYRIKFNASSWSTGATLSVGTMTDPNDPSTYTELQLVNLTSSLSPIYQVYLPLGIADYFAFKPGQYISVNIDNVVYEPLPACVEPMGVTVDSNFPQSTALVSWVSPSVLPSHNFEIEYGVTGFTQGQGTIVEVTGSEFLLENLLEATNYSVYVRRVCDSENSIWVGPVNFYHDYCFSGASSIDGNGITSITMADTTLEVTAPEQAPYYVNLIDQPIAFVAGETVNFDLVFETGFTYDTHIWIDLNKDGVFDNETEKVYTGVSTNANPTTLTGSFVVSNLGDNLTGDYRVRISGADGGQLTPNPCYVGSWGETIDLMATITFPCLTPTDISFTDVGFDYAVIDWEGQGTTNFVLEYGLTGFTQGQGTVIENVTKPYTLEGLTSGATYDFYVRKNCAGVNSDWSSVGTTYIYCDTPEPTGAANQTLVEDELLSDLVINGQNLKYYADPGLTIELPASTVLYSSGTYFVTQTIGCESDSSFIVNVTILPRINEPGVNPTQNFCDGGNLSDIVVSSLPSATVIWYQTLTSTEALPLSTPLVTGTYYVVQTDGVTTSHRVIVNVTVNPTPPNLVPQPVHLCGNFTFGNLTINSLPGAEVKWYASMTATNSIASNVPVATGTYYVTQNFGACESQRVAYQVDQFEALGTPVAAIQTFCGTGTVGELSATGVDGAQMLWYSSANSINALASTTNLATGTYYVAQTINGCYSERRAVAVRVVSLAAPQVSAITVCGSGYVSDLHIPAASGVTFKWFNSPSSTTELAQTEVLSTGTYFVSRVQYGCESARASVNVTVASIPSAPTGSSTQSFAEGATVSNLITNQGSVVWYITYNDALNGVNPLAANMPLVNGTTYYGVVIGSNGCPSLPLAVAVEVVLSNNDFVKDELKYYPNPVVDLFNISYSERIKQIEVFDILGKRVKTINTDNTDVQVDLSDLSSGTYMVQLRTETKSQFIKVVKK